MEIAIVKSRYTRADLLALRYEESARQRPNCANRIDLQTLNFWKISGFPNNSGGSNVNYGSKTSSSPDRERDRDNSSLSSSNSLISSRRAMRNRERAHNYYQRFSSSDQIGVEDGGTPSPANANTSLRSSSIIDHRSISSSHLMPAFAKRRFVIASGDGSNELQNEKLLEDGSESRKENFSSMRSSNNSLGSPMRVSERIPSNDWEPSDKHSNLKDLEQSLASSPTYLSGRQSGERRIGSGRLLPRNDNWEYKNQDTNRSDIEKNQNGNILNQQRHRTCSGKQCERPGELADRRININEHVRDQIDAKRNNVQSGRRTANKEKFNFCDTANQSRGRRGPNSYQMHERHEPEWFSAGPTSQLETIDLHGFDDSEEEPVSLPEADEMAVASTGQSRSSSVGSLTKVKLHSNKTESNEQANNQGHASGTPVSNSEIEFNFEAFLNMDPMEHSLMGNDSKTQSDNSGTSRFSQWFAIKEPANISKPSTQETQEIPSVEDLEAQMTKVDLRVEFGMPINSTKDNAEQKAVKMVTRDTEAFKKLLEQLGSQSIKPADKAYPPMTNGLNISNVRVAYRPNMPPQHLGHGFQEPQPQDDNLQQSINHQKHTKKNDIQVNLQSHVQNQLHPTYAQDPNVSGHLSLQERKRMEAQHLLQSVMHGDISLETLEKEINNPNTAALSREIIANVLYEFSNSGRNPSLQKLTYPNGIQIPMKTHSVFNKNTFEEMFTHHASPIQSIGQQAPVQLRQTISPTPLAFTPTSVLRKMTADKDTTSSSNTNMYPQNAKKQGSHNNIMNDTAIMSANSGISVQPRMILGGNYAMQQQQQHPLNANNPQISTKLLPQLSQVRCQPQVKWPPGGNMPHAKSFGRPILKGNLNSAGSQPQVTVMAFPSGNEIHQMHHQQRIKSVQPIEAVNNDNIHNAPYFDGISQMQHHYLNHQQQQQQQRPQPRYRLVHGQNSTMMNAVPSEGTEKNCLSSLNYHRGGDTIDRLSPTTNQLAQWFSPELLARASAGKLPLLNMDQALSLEEFERSMQHSSATVLN